MICSFPNSKASSAMERVRVHLTGVIVHGHGAYGFFDMDEWPHNANITINVLLNVLSMHPSLPPTLYLQLDNCGRDNKNRFLFAFCCLLVELGVFRKVKVSFLMVGHTHEDVDQMFSRFSTWLNRNNAHHLDALLDGFQKSYTYSGTSPTAVKLQEIYDASGWLFSRMADIRKHSVPHIFRFKKDESGTVVMSCKLWSTDKAWTECTGTETRLLKEVPPVTPQIVRPSFPRVDLVALRTGLSKLDVTFSTDTIKWWDAHVHRLEMYVYSRYVYSC